MTTTRFDAEVRHDGRLHTFTIPSLRILVCAVCGEKVLTEKVDEQVQAAIHEYLQLLTPASDPPLRDHDIRSD
jgi:hypothetical protein